MTKKTNLFIFTVLLGLFLNSTTFATPIPDEDFVKINENTFKMGNSFDKKRWFTKPVHAVTLDTFYICKYETTNAQYAEFLNEALKDGDIFISNYIVYCHDDKEKQRPLFIAYITGENYSPIVYHNGIFTTRARNGHNMENHPVLMVSWYGAKAFCDYYGYKLPTEAQWECAARGNQYPFKYPWASNKMQGSKCNYNLNNPLKLSEYPYTVPVDYYSAYGQYQMHCMAGNVAEWCQDYYCNSYYGNCPGKNPQGPVEGTSKVIRGGAWYSYDINSRIDFRFHEDPCHAYIFTGFRVCK